MENIIHLYKIASKAKSISNRMSINSNAFEQTKTTSSRMFPLKDLETSHTRETNSMWAQLYREAITGVIEEFFGDMSAHEIPRLLQSENEYEDQIAKQIKRNSRLEKSMLDTCHQISKIIKKKRETQRIQRNAFQSHNPNERLSERCRQPLPVYSRRVEKHK